MQRIDLVVLAATLTLAVAAPAHATQNACAAAKQACVSKKLAALLKCHSKNTKPPGSDPAKFAACIQKAKDKFDGGSDPSKGCFAKLEAKYGVDCLTSGDTAALEAAADAFVDDVLCRLDPASTTCPLATPTPTATATPVPPTCTDGQQNGDETDVDCGGTTCMACGLGGMCTIGNDCAATTTCAGNACVCAAGRSDCNANPGDACEVTPATDPSNCGSCNNVCSVANGQPGCAASQCTVASCNAGFANCNGTVADGCEKNLNNDVANCGLCGKVCSSTNGLPSCTAGQCQIACNSGFANCDGNVINGCETNINTNTANCGSCGHACGGGQTCSSGTCV